MPAAPRLLLFGLTALFTVLIASELTGNDRQAVAQEGRLLCVGRAPKDRDGFRDQVPSLEVHDIDDGHRLVKSIPLSEGVHALRGICAYAATDRFSLSHYGRSQGRSPANGYSAEGGGRLLCWDLHTNQSLWDRTYPPSDDHPGGLETLLSRR